MRVVRHRKRRWMYAVLTAVLFPAVVFHATCIAVLGPGTWGSGIEEVPPAFHKPTPELRQLGVAMAVTEAATPGESDEAASLHQLDLPGRILWTGGEGNRRTYLTEEDGTDHGRQRLFADSGNGVSEIELPSGFIVSRPQWVGSRIVAECWKPWAIPPVRKITRYLASWADPTLRPEVAIYQSEDASGNWQFLMPGHTLTVAPDGQHASLLRSGALLAGYFSIHVWEVETGRAPAILSLREHAERGTQSFSFRWLPDSSAFQILGRTDGFDRRSSQRGAGPDGIAMNLLYVLEDHKLYDLAPGG